MRVNNTTAELKCMKLYFESWKSKKLKKWKE